MNQPTRTPEIKSESESVKFIKVWKKNKNMSRYHLTAERSMRTSGKRFVVVFLVAVIMLMVVPEVTHVAKASATIIVPVDYPSISAAIGSASAGDTIIIQGGTYHENPVIDKSLTVEGANSATTIVIGKGGNPNAAVFTIMTDNVTISNLTVESLNYTAAANYASGISVDGNGCSILVTTSLTLTTASTLGMSVTISSEENLKSSSPKIPSSAPIILASI